MSLKYALLGLLSQNPGYGYELKQALERNFSQLQSFNAGQIYTSLARLTEEGLVSSTTIEQTTAPARKVYSLTEPGHKALHKWLKQPVTDSFEMLRSEVFVRLLVQALVIGYPTEGSGLENLLERQRQQFLDQLDGLKRRRLQLTMVVAPGETDPRSPQEQEQSEVSLLMLEGSLLYLEANLRWLDLIEARFQRLSSLRTEPK